MKRKTQAPAPEAPKRAYVPAAYVCQACRINFMDLEHRFRPDDWAAPRDFIFTHHGTLYSEQSLPKLADSLAAHGMAESAKLLREYAAKIASPAAQPDEGELVAVAHVEARMPELERMNAHIARRGASDREELPHSWAADWEAAHQ